MHSFAAKAGLSDRAFDRDHYDVPQQRYQQLIDLGAQEVSAAELTRRLIGSGLRVPARQRPESLHTALLLRWEKLLPQEPEVGAELLSRWTQPHRHYHSATHLLGILEALDSLCAEPAADPPREVLLAAWFHDVVYRGQPGEDEAESARLAEDLLAGIVPDAELEEIHRLILLTRTHDPLPGDTSGALLCDADLSVLGANEPGYARYAIAIRRDYAQVPERDFRAGRSAVLKHLLSLTPLYRTQRGRHLWENTARRNLHAELRRIDSENPVHSER